MSREVWVKPWVHPSTGEVRYYLDREDWWAALGIEAEFYRTGSLRWLTYKGEPVSNNKARWLLSFKVWLEETGAVRGSVSQTHDEQMSRFGLAGSQILAGVQAALDDGSLVVEHYSDAPEWTP